ncbi:hypothetical protein CVU82_02425 [Candidatus Falkowbacteria bacterium HGW-Falkowbacteria-1]|uniref:Transglutaminase-like domain-containing protein n=1 Tax=Candidatus Falkowbacteria bacterium HGW-Falkowbacteria-1 TaxID=2013768 RepID=A0A2N2E9S4_9BACT|nr:MAG: hypothetical protein CVU82_02425 [Candidatus Falkowbacteria bacterium HGW-Falkowbacteria-1]
MKKQTTIFLKNIYISFFLLLFSFLALPVDAATLAQRLSGRIVLQVEESGEAYYINTVDLKRYYLGRPADAFSVMRFFGLGATNSDINNFLKNGARSNLSGKILLQVQDKGQAYYVNPVNLRLYYLGRPTDAFNVMRQLGLGIKNSDLNQISLGVLSAGSGTNPTNLGLVAGPGEKLVRFSWKYKNKQYYLDQVFLDSLYNEYKNSDKNYYYPANNPPSNLREAYYGVFLKQRDGDDSIDKLLTDLNNLSNKEGYNEDEFLEFVMAFVQYMPYDFSKGINDPQNFPYETLYTNTGVCSDFSFLAVLILRKMSYGAAVFDYPDIKHSAAAVLCSEKSSYGSGYCFIETTNYFPIGVFPGQLSSGQAGGNSTNWANVFTNSSLGTVEMLQKTSGKIYRGIEKTADVVDSIIKMEKSLVDKSNELKLIQAQLNQLRDELNQVLAEADAYKQKGDWTNYNTKIDEYNVAVAEYNSILGNYSLKLEIYNFDVLLFNKTVSDFYQN